MEPDGETLWWLPFSVSFSFNEEASAVFGLPLFNAITVVDVILMLIDLVLAVAVVVPAVVILDDDEQEDDDDEDVDVGDKLLGLTGENMVSSESSILIS